MRVTHVKISNFLGLEELEFSPGALTVIEGANGSGKTSTLEAFRTLAGGHDASLIRRGATQSEIVLVLDNGKTITRRVNAEKSPVKVTGPLGAPPDPTPPQRQLNSLFDGLGLNPVQLLTADKKGVVRYLLEMVPVEVSMAELTEAIGSDWTPGAPVDARNGFEVVDRLVKEFENERTGVNRELKAKLSTVDQMTQALPPEAEDGESVLEIMAEKDALLAEEREALAPINAAAAKRMNELTDERDAKLDELRRQAQAVKDEHAAALTKATDEATDQRRKVADSIASKRVGISARLATAQERERQEQRATQARETIAKLREESKHLTDQAAGTQAALDGLGALRLKLLQRLPVPGLEIRDGELWFEGLPFERVNTAKRVKVAIRLAIERAVAKAAGVPLIVVDGLECLDEATFAAFLEVAPETGAQLICSRVADGPLTVKTYEPQPATA